MNNLPLRLLGCCSFLFLLTNLIAQPTQWQASGIGGGGALFTPSVNPANNSELYIACDMTESFHSTNSGATWEVMPFYELRPNTYSGVQFTSDPSIRYSINVDFLADAFRPVKSTDGGETWHTLAADPTGGEAYYLFADPNSTQRILLSSYNDLYFSANGGASFNLVYSTSDLHIGGVFWDGTTIFVGCQTGLLLSTNNGASFSLTNYSGLPAGAGFLSFTGAKEGGNIRLFGVCRVGSMWPGVPGSEYWDDQQVYRLDYDGTPTWEVVENGIPTGAFPFYVAMAQNDINIAYVAGASEYPSHPMVYKTTNGGATWTKSLQTTGNQNIKTGWMGHSGDLNWGWAENAMGFTVARNNPNVAVVTDYGFAHITTDGGTTWNQAYVNPNDANPAGNETPNGKSYQSNGLENTSSWWLTWLDEDNIFASYTDITGVRSTDGGDKWSFDYTGNDWNSTYQVIKHPTQNILYAAVSSVHDLYQSTYLRDNNINNGDGMILVSTNGGASWSVLHDFNHPVIWMAIDPSNPNTMYASVVHSTNGGIYKTTNLQNGAASTWAKTTNPPRTEGHPYNIYVLNDGSVVCTYSGRRNNAGVFQASSGVFWSNNGGTSWEDRSHSGMYYWTKDIVIDLHDATQNTWYACVFSGWGGPPNGLGGLYKTTNRGQSWTRIFAGVDRVESAAIHPTNPDILYLTTESEGLWYTENLTNASPDFEWLEEYTFQHPTRVFFNPYDSNEIWVTSFGNGLRKGHAMTTGLPVELVDFTAEAVGQAVQLQWKVAQSINFSHFEVERSTDGQHFEKLISIKLNAPHQFLDKTVSLDKIYYYRLKLVELDGSFDYSEVVAVQLKPIFSEVKVFPNPTSDWLQVQLTAAQSGAYQLTIYDMLGRQQLVQAITLTSGKQDIQISLKDLAIGRYTVELSKQEQVIYTSNLVLMR